MRHARTHKLQLSAPIVYFLYWDIPPCNKLHIIYYMTRHKAHRTYQNSSRLSNIHYASIDNKYMSEFIEKIYYQ